MPTKSNPNKWWALRFAHPTHLTHLSLFNRSAIRSAIATVVRWVLARGDFGHDGGVDDAQAGAADHPAFGIDHRACVVDSAHAAGAAGVLGVAAFGEQPVVQLGVAERLIHRAAGRAVLDPVRDVGDRRLQADLAQAAHAVAHANEIAAVGQHALLYRRIDRGVCRGDADVALAEGLIDRHRDAAARRADRLLRRGQGCRRS